MLLASPIFNPHASSRAVPFPSVARAPTGCCDNCTCGVPGVCPDCVNSARRVSFGGHFGGATLMGASFDDADKACTPTDADNWNNDAYTSCMVQLGWNTDGSPASGAGGLLSRIGSQGAASGAGSTASTGSGSSSGATNFLSALATGILRSGQPNMMPVQLPWYQTPVGMGAIVLGVVAVYLLAKRD